MSNYSTKGRQLSLYVPNEVVSAIDEYAQKKELSRSGAAVSLIQKALEEEGMMFAMPRVTANQFIERIDNLFESSLDEILDIIATIPHVDCAKVQAAKEKYLNEE